MKIIFMGTPQFAVPSLDILLKSGYEVVAVVTATDSMGGRGGKQIMESAVKKYAVEHDIPVLQPEKLKNPAFLQQLKSFNADIQIVVAFRMLPEVVWNMPSLGTYNLHGSLLPKYRGAAPINHAIIHGEKETGVTSFKLKHEIDTGDIVLQTTIPIFDDENAGSLHDRMMEIGAETVLATPKLFHETCQIDVTNHVDPVHNFVRGLSPYPGAWIKIGGKEIKILATSKELSDDGLEMGTIVTDHKKWLKIKCLEGYISILQLKPEGKKIMTISEYLNGNKEIPNQVD